MRRREREPYTKRKSVTILIIGVVGLALAFTSLSTAAILQSNGVDSKIYTPFGIAFFPICIIDVIFLIYHYPRITLYEFNKQMEKEDFEVLSNINIDIVAYCVRNKFTLLEGGYYYKRRFSWSKDYVNYYILKCESSEIKETLDNEFNKFDSYNFQKRNKCFILFIEKDNVDKDDIKLLVESSYIYISLEVILRVVQDVPIVVLIDKNKKCAYCVPIKKGNISFYNIGYKFAKKIMYTKDNQN